MDETRTRKCLANIYEETFSDNGKRYANYHVCYTRERTNGTTDIKQWLVKSVTVVPCSNCGEPVEIMCPFYGCVFCAECARSEGYGEANASEFKMVSWEE